MERVKRTYNLPDRTVRLVRELASEYGIAPTQDAVVELAVDELARQVRYEQEAELWVKAADDREYRAEADGIAATFGDEDSRAWPE